MMPEQITEYESQLYGTDLRGAVEQELKNGLKQAAEMEVPEMHACITALKDNFPCLEGVLDFNTPRPKGSIRTIVGSIVASVLLALASIGKDFEDYYGLQDKDEWWGVIESVLDGTGTRRVVEQNIWRAPMVVSPLRGVSLQFLLRYHFGGDAPIRGIDLGAGLHVALPLLNSSEFLEVDFPGRAEIRQYTSPVNVVCGLGVDKQDRQGSLDWAKACYWPLVGNLGAARRLEDLYYETDLRSRQFPFLQVDVLDQETLDQKVVSQFGGFDFVFTSFVRHQFGPDENIQKGFERVVCSLLLEGGIWVDIGEELIIEGQYKEYGVRVYKRENDKIRLNGIPFVLSDQTHIGRVNIGYFGTS